MFCKVKYCRYSNYHTTSGHQCGKCKKYGHGAIECGNTNYINQLMKYKDDKLPLNKQCTNSNCSHKYNHTSESHICNKCYRRHFEDNCIIQNFDYHNNRFDVNSYQEFDADYFKTNYINHYTVLNIGMGCILYVKNHNSNLISLFMHSDNWGQYGPDSDDTSIRDNFITGFTAINIYNINNNNNNNNINNNNIITFSCPLCRVEDDKNNILSVKGCDTQCKICLDKNAELYFPKCKHVCCCNDCFNRL